MNKKLYTNKDLFNEILKTLKEKGLYPDILDYGKAESYNIEKLKTCEFDVEAIPSFGGNEGIYLTIYAEGNINKECEKTRLGTFKTLNSSREDLYIISKLGADFVWEAREFIDNHLDDFTWTGCDVKTFKDNKQTGHWTVSNKERAYNLLKRNFKYGYDYAIIIDNETGKETKINKEEIVLD